MDAVIGLGSNLEDRRAILERAVVGLNSRFSVTRVSSLYETEPVGPPQPLFLNAAVRLLADTHPRGLLDALLALEVQHGRVRRERFGPRTLDLDLLWINGVEVSEPDLRVPHPRLMERRFALAPLLDVAPEAVHPATGRPLAEGLSLLPDVGVRRVADLRWAEDRMKTS